MGDDNHHQSAIITQTPSHQDLNHDLPKKKKPRSFGAMHLVRFVLYMLKPYKSKQDKNHKTTSTWHTLLCSMRPFHHVQCTDDSPPRLTEPERENHEVDEQLEVSTSPLSPAAGRRASPSGTEPSSRYASAVNLQELDECDESKEEEGSFDDCRGDEMIDAKADMFIAQFYEQMRLQQEN